MKLQNNETAIVPQTDIMEDKKDPSRHVTHKLEKLFRGLLFYV